MVSDINIVEQIKDLEELADNARLWIFQAVRQLSQEEQLTVQAHLNRFLSGWTSHNRELLARGIIAFDRFIIIALDESKSNMASGCSIDNMTHQIQSLSKHLNLNLMDRTTFYIIQEGQVNGIHMNHLKEAVAEGKTNPSSLVFNNLVKTKGELVASWLVPLGESWHKRFL